MKYVASDRVGTEGARNTTKYVASDRRQGEAEGVGDTMKYVVSDRG